MPHVENNYLLQAIEISQESLLRIFNGDSLIYHSLEGEPPLFTMATSPVDEDSPDEFEITADIFIELDKLKDDPSRIGTLSDEAKGILLGGVKFLEDMIPDWEYDKLYKLVVYGQD